MAITMYMLICTLLVTIIVAASSKSDNRGLSIETFHIRDKIILQCQGHSASRTSVYWFKDSNFTKDFRSADCWDPGTTCSSFLILSKRIRDYGDYQCKLYVDSSPVERHFKSEFIDQTSFSENNEPTHCVTISPPAEVRQDLESQGFSADSWIGFAAVSVGVIGWILFAILLCKNRRQPQFQHLIRRSEAGKSEMESGRNKLKNSLPFTQGSNPEGREANQYDEMAGVSKAKGRMQGPSPVDPSTLCDGKEKLYESVPDLPIQQSDNQVLHSKSAFVQRPATETQEKLYSNIMESFGQSYLNKSKPTQAWRHNSYDDSFSDVDDSQVV